METRLTRGERASYLEQIAAQGICGLCEQPTTKSPYYFQGKVLQFLHKDKSCVVQAEPSWSETVFLELTLSRLRVAAKRLAGLTVEQRNNWLEEIGAFGVCPVCKQLTKGVPLYFVGPGLLHFRHGRGFECRVACDLGNEQLFWENILKLVAKIAARAAMNKRAEEEARTRLVAPPSPTDLWKMMESEAGYSSIAESAKANNPIFTGAIGLYSRAEADLDAAVERQQLTLADLDIAVAKAKAQELERRRRFDAERTAEQAPPFTADELDAQKTWNRYLSENMERIKDAPQGSLRERAQEARTAPPKQGIVVQLPGKRKIAL
jgi:hypothetical protein